jgi:hypothetical protein
MAGKASPQMNATNTDFEPQRQRHFARIIRSDAKGNPKADAHSYGNKTDR